MSPDSAVHNELVMDDLVLDTATHEIRRGDAILSLPGLSYRMLVVLAESAPAVVSHDELVERVWDGRVVSPETVTQRVKLLRSALGDDAARPRYIALVRGEGYRLIPPVEQRGPAATVMSRRGSAGWLQTVAVSATVALVAAGALYFLAGLFIDGGSPIVPQIRPNSLAVLPFEDPSGNSADQYLRIGIASRLTDQLTHVQQLNVMEHSSSEQFADSLLDARGIAARLGVEILIRGTLEKRGDQYRITASIVEGATGFQRWTDEFRGARDDLPLLQRNIAEQIIARLVPEYRGTAATEGSASLDPTIYNLMLLADDRYRDVRDKPSMDLKKLDEAIAYYRQVTTMEPDYAVAHARLAAALLYRSDATSVAAAELVTDRAIAINPDSAEAWYTRGLHRWLMYEDGSGDAFARAIELDRNYADAHEAYAKYLWHQLYSDTPEEHFLRAREFDPARLARYADLGNYYGMSGRPAETRETAAQIAQRFPDDANAYMTIARTLELIGDLDEAIAWARRAAETDSQLREAPWMVAELYARIGDFDTAREFDPRPAFNLYYWERRYEEMIELGDELLFDDWSRSQIIYGLGRGYAALDQFEIAIELLDNYDVVEKALSENRRANDEEAMITLADALKESGRVAEAREIVSAFRPFLIRLLNTGGGGAWWPHLYLACIDSILDDRAAALDSLDRMRNTWGMPWYPLLVDAPCFRALADEPRYRAAVSSVQAQKQELRLRLDSTLDRLRLEWASGVPDEHTIRTNGSRRR